MARRFGMEAEETQLGPLAVRLTEELDDPTAVARLVSRLDSPSRQALALFALTETTVWPLPGLAHALASLGMDLRTAVLPLLSEGMLALDAGTETGPLDDVTHWLDEEPHGRPVLLRIHPATAQGVRVSPPEGRLRSVVTSVSQVREADSLEPVVRLGAMWQRVGVEPLRQTQQGALYKRDFDRINEDPVLAGAVSDALENVPAMPMLWLSLAHRVGLIHLDASGERLEAAGPSYWDDNALHLPQMAATSWLGMRDWWEWDRSAEEAPDAGLPIAFLRPTVLLWLSTLEEDEWVSLEDLGEHLRERSPQWDRLSFQADLPEGAPPPRRAGSARRRGAAPVNLTTRGERVLKGLLLGAGYALGLVRVAEERGSRRTVVQLSALGRYAMALGPPPPPRPMIEHFLFVQPNFEIIAYRQGLNAQLVGQLSRFAWWMKLAAALELRLTQEASVFGFEGGLTAERMIEILARHSQRPLPTLVPDALHRWASHRERITVYAAATLIEFHTRADRDRAEALWNSERPDTFLAVADRLLLVENPQRIPTDRIRTIGARDYRHPPEKCVSVEPDGVTLALDLTRSDLLIDAEMSRIGEEISGQRPPMMGDSGTAPVRRYLVSGSSLSRAAELGVTSAQIHEWFLRRTGSPPSPAIRLLLGAISPTPARMHVRRMLVVTTPTPDLADGLLQHPLTRNLIGDRLGPTSLAIPDDRLDALKDVLTQLGLTVEIE
jgi:hypothetical protein